MNWDNRIEDVIAALRKAPGRKPTCKSCGQKMTRQGHNAWTCQTEGCKNNGVEVPVNQKRRDYYHQRKYGQKFELEDMTPDDEGMVQFKEPPQKVYTTVDYSKGPGKGMKQGFDVDYHPQLGHVFYDSPEYIPHDMPHNGKGVVEVDTAHLPQLFNHEAGKWSTELPGKVPAQAVSGYQALRAVREGSPLIPVQKSMTDEEIDGLIQKAIAKANECHHCGAPLYNDNKKYCNRGCQMKETNHNRGVTKGRSGRKKNNKDDHVVVRANRVNKPWDIPPSRKEPHWNGEMYWDGKRWAASDERGASDYYDDTIVPETCKNKKCTSYFDADGCMNSDDWHFLDNGGFECKYCGLQQMGKKPWNAVSRNKNVKDLGVKKSLDERLNKMVKDLIKASPAFEYPVFIEKDMNPGTRCGDCGAMANVAGTFHKAYCDRVLNKDRYAAGGHEAYSFMEPMTENQKKYGQGYDIPHDPSALTDYENVESFSMADVDDAYHPYPQLDPDHPMNANGVGIEMDKKKVKNPVDSLNQLGNHLQNFSDARVRKGDKCFRCGSTGPHKWGKPKKGDKHYGYDKETLICGRCNYRHGAGYTKTTGKWTEEEGKKARGR